MVTDDELHRIAMLEHMAVMRSSDISFYRTQIQDLESRIEDVEEDIEAINDEIAAIKAGEKE